ncbi:glucagon receptor-like [Chanos chanos]|uniref:Glucagon receptor-like n=1 Tax=Chanos chanos TaxID=29144 RepID=A0A6J2V2K7_CHACN|nr:glucagon receptor-like [Chanos chanos]
MLARGGRLRRHVAATDDAHAALNPAVWRPLEISAPKAQFRESQSGEQRAPENASLFSSLKILEQTYRKWLQYKDDCLRRLEQEPYPSGIMCNRTFDLYACWPDGQPGALVNVSCPSYLPWINKVYQGVVRRRCGLDGQWAQEENGQIWRDISQCEEEEEITTQELWFKQVLLSFRMLYTVGYTLSLISLISALAILLSIRQLRCTRNYIHANLFLSFILRATAVLAKDALLERHWSREISKHNDLKDMLSHRAAIGCRVAQVLMHYCVLANHYWFFGEAVYLHSVLITSVLLENNKYLHYLCLGWGTPLVFVIPWILAKLLKENKECWALNENMMYWWIIRLPILFASLINLLIFMKILRVIFSKLRANNQNGYPDYKLRLAKATLTLIPLFGVHEVIFIFVTDEQTTGMLRYVRVFITLFLNSFQGFLVAVLYCYSNKEVKTELQRRLRGWRRGVAKCYGQ